MDFAAVVAALNSPTRRRITQILSTHALTAKEVFTALQQSVDIQLTCRESAYKALEKLVAAELVTKFYDNKGKAIRYQLTHSKILLDLIQSEVNFIT